MTGPLELLKKSFEIYREKISLIIPLGLIVISASIFQLTLPDQKSLSFIISSLCVIVISYIIYIAFIKLLSRQDFISVGNLFDEVQLCIVSAIAVSLIVTLVISGGFLMLIFPGIIMSILLAFSIFSVVVDGKNGYDALLNSWFLVRGRWWSVLWRFFAANVIVGLIGSFVVFVFKTGMDIGDSHKITLIMNQIVSALFTTPISVAFTYLLYLDLKNSAQEADQELRSEVESLMHFFAGAGVALIVAGLFASGVFVAKFLPDVVNITHSPAAVFEVF